MMDDSSARKGPPASAPRKPEPVDYEHRTTVNLLALIAIMLLAAVIYWTASAISERQKLERCVGSGRRDCFVVPAPPGNLVPVQR